MKVKVVRIGTAITIGELRKLIKEYPDDTPFGFRNQPMQSLFSVIHEGHKESIVFQ
jgi:hypothetical protein